MWQQKTSFFLFALACLLSFALLPLPGDSYLITDSEITQILDECEALKIQLSILKSNSQADRESLILLGENLTALELRLQKANENLTNTQNALTSALAQLAEARKLLSELEASLKQSKLAALWQSIKVGGICLGVGAAVGFVLGAVSK
jgi:chromosome segregation ATPase